MPRPTGTPGFLGLKLTQARKLRRKTIAALAEEIGVTRAAVSAYEKDLRTPSFEVFEALCRCLDVPALFFTSDCYDSLESNGPIFYRSYISALKMARESAEVRSSILSKVVDYLGEYVNFPEINVPKFEVPSDPTALGKEEIERIAEKTRAFWQLSLGPISDIVCLLENNGIVVGKFPLQCEKLDAFSQRRGGQFQIVIGSDKTSCVRQRFDAAHELGHILLHRKVPKELVEDKAFFKIIENQAHYFAFEFLFPSKAFKSELRRLSLNEFMRLKLRWKVSVASILERVSRSDFAAPGEVAPLRRAFYRNGWKTQEPFDDETPCEEPRLLREAFEIILSSKTQSPKDISNRVNLYFSDIEEICGLTHGYISSFNKGNVLELKQRFQGKPLPVQDISRIDRDNSEATQLSLLLDEGSEGKPPAKVLEFQKIHLKQN